MVSALTRKVTESHKDSEFGSIPEDWELLEAFDFSPYITSGSRGWARHYSDSGAPFIRIGNLSHSDIYPDLSDLRHVKVSANDPEAIRTRLAVGDILVSITADIGAIGYVSAAIPTPAYINQHIACLRLPSEKVDSRFVAYFLSSSGPQRRFSAMVDVGAKSGLNLTAIGKLKLLVPPLREQHAIAAALSDADGLIEGLESLIAKKRAIKRGVMQELLSGRRRLAGLRGKWNSERLSDIAEIRSGGTPSTARPDFWNGHIQWCTPTDITALDGGKYLRHTSRKITDIGLKDSSAEWIPARSVIMTSRATIGECAINVSPVTTNQGFKNLVPRAEIDVEFLYYAMTTQKERLVALCGGSTFLEISKTQLANFEIVIPTSKAEQTAISTILAEMDEELEVLNARLAKARQIKQGMMQELLTGRVRLV